MSRTTYDSRFKSKVALEAIRGAKTVAQIASEYQGPKHVQAETLAELRKAVRRCFIDDNGDRPYSSFGYRHPQRCLQEGIGKRRLDAVWSPMVPVPGPLTPH